MSLDREDIITAKIDAQDVLEMVKRRLDSGAHMVFLEEDYRSHKIYVSENFALILGGYRAVDELVRKTFHTTEDLKDKTKPKFFFGHTYSLGDHKGVFLELSFPTSVNPSLQKTQDAFTRAARLKIENS